MASFKIKQKITGQTGDDGTKDVGTMIPLKYLNNFWRTLQIPLISCESILILVWLVNCFIIANAIDVYIPTFAITDTKFYILVVTLST